MTVLGAGGTAQAALVALAQLGVTACAVLVRDRVPAPRAGGDGAAAGRPGRASARWTPDAPELGADLVVSTLPPGAADPLAARAWTPGQTLLDVVYDPWPTAIAAAVEAAGGVVVSGAQMLLHQAAAQVELMTGRSCPRPRPPPGDAAPRPACRVRFCSAVAA